MGGDARNVSPDAVGEWVFTRVGEGVRPGDQLQPRIPFLPTQTSGPKLTLQTDTVPSWVGVKLYAQLLEHKVPLTQLTKPQSGFVKLLAGGRRGLSQGILGRSLLHRKDRTTFTGTGSR